MIHSQAATDLVASFEGCSLVAYQDGNGIWTIGYGHTGGVKEGDTCTQPQALEWLSEDLTTADDAIARLVTVPLAQNEWDALTSLVFNIGQGNFEHGGDNGTPSAVLRCINAGDTNGCCRHFMDWKNVAGKVSPGLVRRRTAEQAMFSGAE